ncbi:MAG: DUF6116 family protein [Planctomycetota bacterium]|jgi:hypothetical protein
MSTAPAARPRQGYGGPMSLARIVPTALLAWFGRLRFPTLLAIAAVLFVADLAFPDALPFADELLLGVVTAVLASWKKRRGVEAAEEA